MRLLLVLASFCSIYFMNAIKMAYSTTATKLPRVSAEIAAKIDQELMNEDGFSIDQLMELAGLAVAECVHTTINQSDSNKNVLILAGPGNNGGDGLVAARHLYMLGYKPLVYYPKPSKSTLFDGLQTQLHKLKIPFIPASETDQNSLQKAFNDSIYIVDALFGFSFKPPVRGVFIPAMRMLTDSKKPILAVDIPSSWDVNNGPCSDFSYNPEILISLTAPKKSADHFKGRHFIGGRFISKEFAEKYGFKVPPYVGLSQIWEEK